MFNIMNFLAIVVESQESWVNSEEAAKLEQEAQDKSLWIVLLVLLLLAEIFFALIFPKIQANLKLKKEAKEKRKREHREKR